MRDTVELVLVVVKFTPQGRILKQPLFVLVIAHPEELMGIHSVDPDLPGNLLQVNNDTVDRSEAVQLAVQKDKPHDNKHHRVNDDTRKPFLLAREHIQINAYRHHRDICQRKQPLV